MIVEACAYLIIFDDGEEFFIERRSSSQEEPLWVILDGDVKSYCLSKNLIWIAEPRPSERTENFCKTTRFKFDEAIELLKKWKMKERQND